MYHYSISFLVEKACGPEEWACKSKTGDCIPKAWVCDDHEDCHDKSDEKFCSKSKKSFQSIFPMICFTITFVDILIKDIGYLKNSCNLTASACSERSNVKCGEVRINTHRPNTTSEEACQMICEADDKCNYFFWSIDNYCATFKTCDWLKTAENPGTIYAKKGLCSGII